MIGYIGPRVVCGLLTLTYWIVTANVWTDNSKKLRSVFVFNLSFSVGFFLPLDWLSVGLVMVVMCISVWVLD